MSMLRDMADGYHQEITASLKLLQYTANPLLTARANGSFSVLSVEGDSGVSTPYSYTITFISDDTINIEEIVDTEAQLNFNDSTNPLNSKKIYGKVYEAREASVVARKRRYIITLVSPLHYLSLNRRYEMFQNKPVASIIQEIVGRYESLLNLKLDSKIDEQKLPSRQQCTQYAQSDLEFIKMLCESEGYVFLCDASLNEPYTITLCELSEHARLSTKTSNATFNIAKHFNASAQEQKYYEGSKPSLDMRAVTGQHIHAPLLGDNEFSQELRVNLVKERLRDRLDELEASRFKDLQRYSQVDSQRGHSATFSIEGSSDELFLSDGLQLTLNDAKSNKSIEAILLKLHYSTYFPNALDEYKADGDNTTPQYSVTFEAIPKEIVYKPQELTPKPKIHGLQSAIVSGGDSATPEHANEIDVNEKGEIRVIFHFDKNRPTSCYVPLSNMASGDGYGTQFLPRVNSEVLVSFINGDIDRPIIIGTLHNGENRHAYNLPKEKTKSFIKTQSTPQYEDKEGYNELLFEDKRGEEALNLRAQRDYSLTVLNDADIHVHNTQKSVIDTDSELTVHNDLTQTIGNNARTTVSGSQITSIEKEQLTTVKEDSEQHLLKNATTIVNENHTTIVEKELIERIKGAVTRYTEQEAKEKYLADLFMQIGKTLGIEVTEAYHLKADSIKEQASTIEIEATDGISLKCGGNVLTIDSSGISLKGSMVDTNASSDGVTAAEVSIPDIEKPLYNKLRVTALEASISKQDDITQLLTYTATVEKYEDGAWAETTDLNETQLSQINWYFIKNNDEDDTDVLTDNPTDDTITIDGLEMSVTLNEENIYRFGHAHAFVVESEAENGHALTELKRFIEVEELRGNTYAEKDDMLEYKVVFNVDDITEEERSMFEVEVIEIDKDDTQKSTIYTIEEDLIVRHTLEKGKHFKKVKVQANKKEGV